ncbi:hypothetical protein D3C87_1176190 [compost metagenome]
MKHVFGLPRQAQTFCQTGLIGQVNFNFVGIAFSTAHIGSCDIVDEFKACRTFGECHQFVFKLGRIGGAGVRFKGENFDPHVVEQLRASIGTSHWITRHGEEFFSKPRIDVGSV